MLLGENERECSPVYSAICYYIHHLPTTWYHGRYRILFCYRRANVGDKGVFEDIQHVAAYS